MEHNIDQATKNYTIFCDLDGTLWEQGDPTEIAKPGYQPKIIHGSVDKIREWDSKGFKIIDKSFPVNRVLKLASNLGCPRHKC